MRTTLRLSAEARKAAEAVARRKRVTLGQAVSELILRKKPVRKQRRSRGGLPVFACDRTVTADDVRSLEL